MPRPDDILSRAESGDRSAIEEVFRDVHPSLHRITRELVGEEERAERMLNAVFHSALRVLPQWSSWGDPQTWFCHSAVLAARRVRQGRPGSDEDLLVTALPPAQRSPAYIAFVRGIRRLPPQHLEAFLLHHGERLNPRLLGVAMDCSTTAAETHLAAANAAMQTLAGGDWAVLTAQLAQACRGLTPEPAETQRVVRMHISAWAGRRRARRIGWLVTLGIIAVVLFVTWQLRDVIRQRFFG